ncbi:MAG TPA: DUF4340 domain-containing protein [Thermoanaerobaculia bacterium]|nr:DUF4340 domain-containing protein [Thermoanaerobaculia bacterium]
MKPRTLLVLFVLVLGLGAFVWFYERKLPSSEERTASAKKVLTFDKAEVTAVAIDSPKGQIRLERTAGPAAPAGKDKAGEPAAASSSEWRLIRPLATRADSFAVDRLLDGIAGLEKTRTLDDVDAKAVGLDKPRAVVRLKMKKGGETVLKLGAEVPPGGSLIAGVDGRKGAYVVGDAILSEVDKAPGDWRDRLIFHGNRDAVQRIVLTGAPGGPVTLAKRPDGFWIESPFVDRADHDLVDGLLSDLTGLTADRFLDGSRSAAALGLEPPHGSVEVVLAGSPGVRIDLGTAVTGAATPEGQPSGEVSYARVGDASFEVRTRLGESARRVPVDWRALQLSAFEVHQVDSATVTDGGAPVALTRSGTDWKRGDTLISYLPVSDLLFAVTGARADRILTSTEAQGLNAGTARPLLTFALHTKDAGDETLTLYPQLAGGVPARVSGRDVVLMLPADTLTQIQAKLKTVREAKATKPEK